MKDQLINIDIKKDFYCNDEIHYPEIGRCENECDMCKEERYKNMDAKKKAEQIVNDIQSSLFSDGWEDSKECALISVYEILNILKNRLTLSDEISREINFWMDVNCEIEKL